MPPARSLPKRLWYEGLKLVCRLLAVVLLRVRCRGRQWVPREGGVLVVANHQSHLDPVLIGLACDRRLNYLARRTLFGFAPFRWLITSLDAIPIDRDGLGLAGLKETLRRLKRGEMVLIFPEGTRTHDGQMGAFRPGFCTVVRRARAAIVPAAIDGAFEHWPRTRAFPLLGGPPISVQFGPPIRPEVQSVCDDAELVEQVRQQVRELLPARASAALGRFART